MYKDSHNPYFNRWFSAIRKNSYENLAIPCHNPYFNRWFSAMGIKYDKRLIWEASQSLF